MKDHTINFNAIRPREPDEELLDGVGHWSPGGHSRRSVIDDETWRIICNVMDIYPTYAFYINGIVIQYGAFTPAEAENAMEQELKKSWVRS